MSSKIPRAMYSLDWLQVFCLMPLNCDMTWKEKVSPRSDSFGNHHRYTMAGTKEFIAGYNMNRALIRGTRTVAIIAWCPLDKRKRFNGCAVKIVNPVLYCADWYFILMDVLAVLEWEPHNLTRVDLACDLNYFVGGLLPDTFIRKYVCRSNASYIRHGSNKWALYGIKEMRCTVFDSIRWGSRSSGVSVYLYNKTKELRDKKDKPWIREAWEEALLSSTLDVWRVEISITSQGLGLRSIGDDVLHTLFIDDLRTPEYLQNMFLTYASRYFKFFRTDREAKRKRDLKEVQLLPVLKDPKFKPTSIAEYINGGRMERIVSNKLYDVVEYLQARDFPNKYETIDAIRKAEVAFNSVYHIKSSCHQAETALEGAIVRDICGEFGERRSEAYLERLRWARLHIEQITQIAKEQARDALRTSLDVP